MSNSLYSNEAIDLLIERAYQKITEQVGIDDRINISEELIIERTDIYTIWGDQNEVDVLFIFAHTGIDIPRKNLNLLNLENADDVVEALYINRDAGSGFLLSTLSEDIKNKKLPFKAACIMYNFNRNAIDANRLQIAEQLPVTPYKGISLWKQNVDRQLLSDKFVDPYFKKVEELIAQLKPKLIFHPHTYDTYGGQGAGSNAHDLMNNRTDNKRPASMLIKKYSFDSLAYGKYGLENETAEFDIITDDEIKIIQETQKKYLSRIEGIEETVKVTVDFPYASPRQLPGLIHKFTEAPQVVIENRKDLFKNGAELIYKSIVEMTAKLLAVSKIY